MSEPLRPPRLTGKAETDLIVIVEFIWSWYRAIVLEREYVQNREVGETVQPADALLTALAALEPTDINNLPYFTAADAAALTPLSAFARTLLDDASAAGARGTLGLGALAVLNTVSAIYLDPNSVTYAKIQTVPQDRLLGRATASTGDIEEITCTSAGRALLDDASAAAQRDTLGLGALALLNTLASSLVVGTSLANDAAAGVLGEVASGQLASGSAVSLTTATPTNVTSVSLTAGDWDVTGVVDYVAAGATTSDFKSGISTSSATFGGQDTFVNLPLIATALSDTLGHVVPTVRISLAATTTVYLVGQADFSLGATTAYGTIRARRVR